MDINRNNYEIFFLLYLDKEMKPADMRKVENFLAGNPDLQKEFTLLQQTIQLPEEIIFKPKESLLRNEEKRRVIPLFRMRVAAAIALLLAGSWFLMTVVVKNQKVGIAGNGKMIEANIPGKKEPPKLKAVSENGNPSDQTGKKIIAENRKRPDLTGEQEILNKSDQRDPSVVKAIVENKNLVKTKYQKRGLNQTGEAGPDTGKQPPPDFLPEPVPDGQKSNAAVEIQAAEIKSGRDSKQVPALTGMQMPALVLTGTQMNDQNKNENTDRKEPAYQTDNAISVLALNDRNKAITGLFKKLTKRPAGNETAKNEKKLRISIFQFSY